jgi:hypothetical protein
MPAVFTEPQVQSGARGHGRIADPYALVLS